MSYAYPSLESIKMHLQKIGEVISTDGLPRAFGPLIFVFTGNGNVSQGAQHVFQSLPHTYVKPSELKDLVNSTDFDNKRIYACEVNVMDHIIHAKTHQPPKDVKDYYQHPSDYISTFAENIAPYATMIINGIYWDSRFPRLVTSAQMKALHESGQSRLLTLTDISCDINVRNLMNFLIFLLFIVEKLNIQT